MGSSGGHECPTSALTWSKMGSSTESNTRAQNGAVNDAPWNFSVSNSTCAGAVAFEARTLHLNEHLVSQH
jgi:hypothetical protein